MRLRAAAEFTGLSRSTLYRLMTRGELPYVLDPATGRRLIPRRALVERLEAHLVVQLR